MNNEEIKNILMTLENAISDGILDVKNNDLFKIINKKKSKINSKISSNKLSSDKSSSTSICIEDTNKLSSDKSSSTSIYIEDTNLLSMTYNVISSDFFIENDIENDSASYYNLGIINDKIIKNGDSIIEFG
jgi:hypothetical protein